MASNVRLSVGTSAKPPLIAPTCSCAQKVQAEPAPNTTLRTTNGGPNTRIPSVLPSRNRPNSSVDGASIGKNINRPIGTEANQTPRIWSLASNLLKTTVETTPANTKI